MLLEDVAIHDRDITYSHGMLEEMELVVAVFCQIFLCADKLNSFDPGCLQAMKDCLLFGTSQMFFVGGATNISLASHLQDKGLSQATAVSVITVWATVGIAGGLLGGELRQRLSVRVALPIVMMATTVSLSLLIVIENVWMAYVFALWHGLFFGAMLPLNQIVFADYFGRWSIGAIRGVSAPVQWGLNAAGPVTAGLVFDSRGSYDSLFVVFIGLMLFGAALIFMAGKPPSPPGEDPSRRDPADPAPRSEAAPEPVPPGP